MPRTQSLRTAILFLAGVLAAPVAAMDDPVLEQGRVIVETNCSRCHAVGRDDVSQHPQAPAFRTLSERYPIDALEEAFAEGIVVGHPDMPEFVAEPDQIASIIAYIESIQAHAQ